jgi:MATE family multidrug resistance protein
VVGVLEHVQRRALAQRADPRAQQVEAGQRVARALQEQHGEHSGDAVRPVDVDAHVRGAGRAHGARLSYAASESRLSPVRNEIRALLALALPAAATQLSTMLMGFVDTVLLGHLGVRELAASSIANVWIHATLLFAIGVILGIDPLVAQAHGRGDAPATGLAAQRGLVVAAVLSVPLALAWFATERVLLAVGQDAQLARDAQVFALAQIPSIPFFLAFNTLRQYLQGRGIVRPAMWVILLANVLNLGLAWALIFGRLGLPALGLLGAGIATSLTRAFCLFGLVFLIARGGLHAGAWPRPGRALLDARALRQILVLGVPVALHVSLEIWAFSGAALLAGWLGAVPLAAHTIALNLASLSFMLPLGISQGAVTRVGNLLGARRAADAERAAWVAIGFGAAVMLLSGAAFLGLRHALPGMYTADLAVIGIAATILPIAAAFQIFDGTQVVCCGVLRGMGRTRPAAWFNLLGYWVLGLPVGAWLAFRADWGLPGIWWGLCFGLGIVAISLVLFVRARGPAHRAPA